VKEQISVKFEVYYPSVKIWFKVAAYPTQVGLAAYFQDVTQEKELKLEVEKSEQNLTALINNTEDMIWLVDADLRLLSFNHPFHQAIKALTGKHIQRGPVGLKKRYSEGGKLTTRML
jgi:PAS domain-containing protein